MATVAVALATAFTFDNGIKAIKMLFPVFEKLVVSSLVARPRKEPSVEDVLLRRCTILFEALESAAQNAGNKDLPPAVVSATKLLLETLEGVVDMAKQNENATLITRILTSSQYQQALEKAGDTVTAISSDINLVLNLHLSPAEIAAEFKAAAERDHDFLLESMQQLLEMHHGKLYKELQLQHQDVLEALTALDSRIKDLQAKEQCEKSQILLGRVYKHAAVSISVTSGVQPQRSDAERALQHLRVTSFDFSDAPDGKIGRGGFGLVVRATWNATGTRVAIKRLLRLEGSGNSADSSIRELVAQEALMWSSLHHPHVLPLLGVSLTCETPFFVMPLMENGDLSSYAVGRPQEHVRLLHETAQGMAYLHSKRIFHGDLKANNVLIDYSGRAKVCDFGMARLLAAAGARASAYSPGSSAGNVRWIAPERYAHGAKYQFEPDVFAFAMVVYEVIAGKVPFSNEHEPNVIMFSIQQGKRPPAPTTAASYSPTLWAVVERCWNQDLSHASTVYGYCLPDPWPVGSP
ncbi:TKL protein kinase [Allomyces macrogynus ATCC 38327]|uniref:TKL protein kinase n=1 Tax=Allomyces macrogynus (strain ATCC 38327) TaxID=578462 RepID=A0A0L0T1C7_ALLM3|nr:TKL protein kinase [Allomyces macrogynus ATCC 38327]|eukprot:KNE68618.1 TKL protein kinase [Allomyces macrogynus ATCC 38327]